MDEQEPQTASHIPTFIHSCLVQHTETQLRGATHNGKVRGPGVPLVAAKQKLARVHYRRAAILGRTQVHRSGTLGARGAQQQTRRFGDHARLTWDRTGTLCWRIHTSIASPVALG